MKPLPYEGEANSARHDLDILGSVSGRVTDMLVALRRDMDALRNTTASGAVEDLADTLDAFLADELDPLIRCAEQAEEAGTVEPWDADEHGDWLYQQRRDRAAEQHAAG